MSCRLSLAALWVLLPVAAVAAPRVELTVERGPGAEDCPDAPALEGLVARIIAAPSGGGRSAGVPLVASVRFARAATGTAATLRVRDGQEGERTLTDTDATCTALGRAVGITLALILDARADVAPPVVPVAGPLVGVAAVPSPHESSKSTSTSTSMTTSGALLATLGPAFGLVGRPTLAGGLDLEVRLARRLVLEVGGQWAAPRSTTFDTGQVDVGLVAALVGVCGVLAEPDGPVVIAACARGVAGELRGAGTGFFASNAATLAWWGAGGGLEVRGAFGRRWLLGVSADVLAPLRHDTFSVGNRGVAVGADAVAAMLRLGVGVRLW